MHLDFVYHKVNKTRGTLKHLSKIFLTAEEVILEKKKFCELNQYLSVNASLRCEGIKRFFKYLLYGTS